MQTLNLFLKLISYTSLIQYFYLDNLINLLNEVKHLNFLGVTFDLIQLNQKIFKQSKEKFGEGGFGLINAAYYLSAKVALKILKKEDLDEKLDNEAQISRLVSNLYTPKVIGIINNEAQHEKCMVLEFINGRTLESYIYNNKNIDDTKNNLTSLTYSIDLARCINYIGKLNIIHRDLKPDNIMISNNLELKVIDFGISKKRNNIQITTIETGTGKEYQTNTKETGTLRYMAPENVSDILITTQYDFLRKRTIR